MPAAREHSFMTGRHAKDDALPRGARERTVLWTEEHAAEGHEAERDEEADLLVLLARRVEQGEQDHAVNLLQTAATLTYRVRVTY